MHDSVYVFDADANPCVTYWHQTLIPTGETYGASADVGTADIYPDIGILGTPVIDPSTQTIYLVTKTKTSGTNYIQRLHALSVATGAEATNSPVTIAATSPGSCEGGSTNTFNSLTENQRPGLGLSNGMVSTFPGRHTVTKVPITDGFWDTRRRTLRPCPQCSM